MNDILTFVIKKSSDEKRPHLSVAWILKCSCAPEYRNYLLYEFSRLKVKRKPKWFIQKVEWTVGLIRDYNDVEHFPDLTILKNTQWALDVIVTILFNRKPMYVSYVQLCRCQNNENEENMLMHIRKTYVIFNFKISDIIMIIIMVGKWNFHWIQIFYSFIRRPVIVDNFPWNIYFNKSADKFNWK